MSLKARTTADPDRVLLAVRARRDRELLAEWLEQYDDYDVVATDGSTPLPPRYDVCLVDDRALAANRSALAERKRDADPVYLPHLLLSDDGDRGVIDRPIDDVVRLPVERAVLRRRVDAHPRTRHTAERLAEHEEQYRRLVELTPETILLVDDGEIAYANAAAADLFDAPDPATVEGRTLTDAVRGEDADVLASLFDRIEARDGAPPGFVELVLRTANGRTVPVEMTGVNVTYEGRPLTQLVVRDLSERKERERRLRVFRRAIESAAQGVTIADATRDDYPLTYVNPAFTRITGYDREDVIGRNCRFLQGSNTDPAAVERIRTAIEAGEPITTELLNYRADGTPFWNHLDIVPIRDDGDVTHFLGLQEDVTKRKQHELRISVLTRVLRHNFRNEMNVIRGYAERIENGESLPEGAAKIRGAADELLTIGTQMYEFDTLLGENEPVAEPFDLADVIETTLTSLRENTPGADVETSHPERARVVGHPTLRAAFRGFLAFLARDKTPAYTIDVRFDGHDVLVDVVDRGDHLGERDVELVGRDAETPLEHLDRLEPWLLRWTVEQSNGEFDAETISSGVPEFDEQLNGGIERGTVTILTGPTGVGKTTTGAQFMKEAAGRGEHSTIYMFEENKRTFLERCTAVNIPVERMIDRGTLSIDEIEALEYSAQEFADTVRSDVEERGTQIVMIDGVNGYDLSIRGDEHTFRREIHRLCRYLKNAGVTVILIEEVPTVTGDFKDSDGGISYLADNIVFLRHIGIRGELRKVVGVLKKRTSDFQRTLREFEITEYGSKIGEPLTEPRGILHGTPDWSGDTQ